MNATGDTQKTEYQVFTGPERHEVSRSGLSQYSPQSGCLIWFNGDTTELCYLNQDGNLQCDIIGDTLVSRLISLLLRNVGISLNRSEIIKFIWKDEKTVTATDLNTLFYNLHRQTSGILRSYIVRKNRRVIIKGTLKSCLILKPSQTVQTP